LNGGFEMAGDFPVHEHLATLGVSLLSEWDALVFLYHHGSVLTTAPQIARLAGYDEAVFGSALDRLESLGLIQRSPGARGVHLYCFFLAEPLRLSCFVELMGLADTRPGRLELISHLQPGQSGPTQL
jgi:hypothetical protein